MIPVTTIELMTAFCRLTGRYAMFISIHVPRDTDLFVRCVPLTEEFAEVTGAAPYLRRDDCAQIMADEHGILLFDTEDEMERYYAMTIGDDGPTFLNNYNGPVTIYALTCGPEGTRNENT